jgi:hypothetical protein
MSGSSVIFRTVLASTGLAWLRCHGHPEMRNSPLVGCLILGLCLSLWPLRSAQASGVFWLPTRQASDASFDHLNPVLAAYHNHAHTLSVRVNGTSAVTSVFFSTDESGRWTTQLVSDQGPANTYSREFTSLAVDASTGRLYAAWVYQKSLGLGRHASALVRDPRLHSKVYVRYRSSRKRVSVAYGQA